MYHADSYSGMTWQDLFEMASQDDPTQAVTVETVREQLRETRDD